MDPDLISRRHFLLRSSATTLLPLLTGATANELLATYHTATSAARPPGALTPAQLRVVEAAAERIFPAVDGLPGASAMHVPQFIDAALAGVLADARKTYVEGIGSLDARSRTMYPKAAGFAALAEVQQDAVLAAVAATPFFQMLRGHKLVACFADPRYGGNF